MKLPNSFKILWWIILVIGVGYLCSKRFGAISVGAESPEDAFLFLIWIALLLLPLFNEFEFFGIKLKAQLEDLKMQLTQQVCTLRTEFHSTVNSQISPNIYLNPPPDSQLPQDEERFRKILDEVMSSYGIESMTESSSQIDLPEQTSYLFGVRYSIEKELTRIYDTRIPIRPPFREPLYIKVKALTEAGLISPQLQNVVLQLYSICNPAIHGQQVSEEKIKFVKDIAPNLIASLKAIK